LATDRDDLKTSRFYYRSRCFVPVASAADARPSTWPEWVRAVAAVAVDVHGYALENTCT
jgi:hypothetical protein